MTVYVLDDRTPQCAEGSWVAPNAVVLGSVSLAEGASIWFGAVLRGDNDPIRIGAGSNVQENAILHTDAGYPLTVGQECTVGHGAILHGCTIGDGSLVGMGATVLNGARVGRQCLIGANSLVTTNMVIPDGSLVLGAPAKVVRPLKPQELEMLAASAAFYRANANRLAGGLRAVS
jgi:carbonic anhydrase/acetyltransferase-like protein (isoleucine patch superfamily)